MALVLTKIVRPLTLGRKTLPWRVSGVGSNTNPPTTSSAWSEAADPLDPINHDETTTYLSKGSGAGAPSVGMKPDTTFPEKMALVMDFRTGVRLRATSQLFSGRDTYQPSVSLNATDVNATAIGFAAQDTWKESVVSLARPGGGAWVESDFRASSFEFFLTSAGNGPAIQLTSLWAEIDYIAADTFIETFREAYSRRLRRSSAAPRFYELQVPIEEATMELLDDFRLSHEDLPRVRSLVRQLEKDGMMESWQSAYMRFFQERVSFSNLSSVLTFEDEERVLCLFFSSFQVPGSVNEDYVGLIELDNGQKRTFERAKASYVQQSDGLIATILSGAERMNHLGMWCAEGGTNDVLNSNFQEGLTTSWSLAQDGTGGSLSEETTDVLFVNKTSFPRVAKLVRGDDASWIEQSVSVSSTDGFRRLSYFDKRLDSVASSFALQRSSDNQWWNDVLNQWQTTKIWCDSPAGELDMWNRNANLYPIPIGWTGTALVQIGRNLGSSGDELLIGQVDFTKGRYLLPPIPTADAAETVDADIYKRVIDDTAFIDRQTAYAKRGTVRFTLHVQNAPADVVGEGDELALVYLQYGTGTSDYDVVLVKHAVSEDPRLAFRRVRSGSVDKELSADVDWAQDDEVKLAVRWVAEGELGLSDNTLSLFEDGELIAEQEASGQHSETEKHTELWVGSAPSALGFDNANQVISNLEVVQRVIPNEAILAGT